MSKSGKKSMKGKANKTIARQRKQSKKIVGHDPKKENKGGFYKEMRGVTIDENGNRKMIGFFVEEEGYGNAYLKCHPRLAKLVIEDVMTHNDGIQAIVEAAVMDRIFRTKNPLNWPIKIRYRLYVWWKNRKHQKEVAKRNKIDAETAKAKMKVVTD